MDIRSRACAAAVLLGALAGAAGASAQPHEGMFPAKPDDIAPRLIAKEDAPLSRLTPVTDAMLANPPASDWLMWRRTYNGWGYSPLDQINRADVKGLQLAWSWSLGSGAMENTPLEHDGVLFVQAPDESVVALNAANGDLLWRYVPPTNQGGGIKFKRMIAIEGDRLFIADNGKHLVALDIHTGQPVWDQETAGDGTFTSGPMALDGKVIIGSSNCVTSRCYITAHDAATGKELWRFYTVAAPDEPGGDTWNGLPADARFGGSTWTSGSYDPGTGLLYYGVGQPYPWNAFARGTPIKSTDNPELLYTDNTLALDPNTGKLVWHYSHLHDDSWDLDYTFERQLIDLPVDGKMHKVALTAGKMAILEGLDARTGKFLFADDLGVQTVVSHIDPKTGEKTINPAVIPHLNEPVVFCPHPGGGRGPNPTAYDPQTGDLYVPMQDHCTEMTALPLKPGEKTETSKFTLMLKPGSDGNIGRLVAVNMNNRTTVWQHRERSPQSTGALPTGGGVVFDGDLDRYFSAYDARTGELLWRTRLADTPNGPPITFSVNGRQYIAVTTGSGSPFTHTFGNLIPDVRDPPNSSAAVWVFALPETR